MGGLAGAARGAIAGGEGDFASRFASLAPNPIREMLTLRVGLRLSDSQEVKLSAIADSLTAQNAALARELQGDLAKLGANPEPVRMMTAIRPKLQQAQQNLQAALDAAKAVLSVEQWNYLPERLRTPRGMLPGGDGPRRPPG